MNPLRILVADDHEVVRRGVRALLDNKPDWKICGEASSGRQAVAMAKELAPDIVILDISMPELNGLEAARQIRKAAPDSEILVLTIHDSEQMVKEVLAVGARGYLVKSDVGPELLNALEALSRHKPYFTRKVTEIMLREFTTDGQKIPAANVPITAADRLTPREREIVQLLAEGRSSKEVATALGISVKTAETHRTNLMRKLDLHSIGEIVRYAVRNHIIEP